MKYTRKTIQLNGWIKTKKQNPFFYYFLPSVFRLYVSILYYKCFIFIRMLCILYRIILSITIFHFFIFFKRVLAFVCVFVCVRVLLLLLLMIFLVSLCVKSVAIAFLYFVCSLMGHILRQHKRFSWCKLFGIEHLRWHA